MAKAVNFLHGDSSEELTPFASPPRSSLSSLPFSRSREREMDEDPFIRDYDAAELEIAAEFLTNWLPFLTRGLCDGCSAALHRRIQSICPAPAPPLPAVADASDAVAAAVDGPTDPKDSGPRGFELIEASGWDTEPDPSPAPDPSGWEMEPERTPEPSGWDTDPAPASEIPKVRMSWADMAQEDELEEEEEEARRRSSLLESSEEVKKEEKKKPELSREQREQIRFRNVGRKKDFICLERVNGKIVNILNGLELHTGVFSAAEQKRIVDFVYELQEKGKNKQFGENTYSEPRKWMRGKGRVTIQFGCCYNYAMKNGIPPGILQNVVADPLPPLFKVIIRRLVRWHVLPTSSIPDSCIVNIYEPGDCIPPHIDSHDFVRPFCTVSFLSECNILFGSQLKTAGPGEFTGSIAIPLPIGSVLVLNGNGADVAMHCVPAVPTKRISITFRKMDESKRPTEFIPEPDLQNILPLPSNADPTGSLNHRGTTGLQSQQPETESNNYKKGWKSRGRPSRLKPVNHSQHPPYDLGTAAKRLAHRDEDTVNSDSDRGRESVGRLFESKPFESGKGDADALTERSLQQRPLDEESVSMEGRREHSGRRVWLEQKRIVVSRDMEGEEDSIRKGPLDEGSGSMEGNREYSGRRVKLDQNRIVISRNIEAEEEAMPTRIGSLTSEPGHISRVSVRSLNNGRRRVRVNLSDD